MSAAKEVIGIANPASFDSALRAHQAGRLDEAEALYEAVLGHDPRHATALQMFGVLQA